MPTPPFNVSNISTGMSLIIFFCKSIDITLCIAALFPMLLACVAGAWEWWAKERTGAREGDTRVSSRARTAERRAGWQNSSV